ncbi:hypothetical protein QBC34DRAFT_153899 [Podospora aff. communis PSN243]|uniref:Methyltransferase n=1 Tax=Podospora aff. communis PSN243 TaxID=3040156 RepID=A0AAV9GBS4_9PEZI|nr:hypothetical protein QBC34DRAFT_153899 [Podospora aff. communis PSN243]
MAAFINKRNEAHTTGTFTYMKWNSELYETESPFQILIEIPKNAPDQRTTNVEFEAGPPETITDVRTTMDSWSLDQHGFQYFSMNTGLAAKRFSDPAFVREKYLPQCVSLLKKALPGAERVHFFGWRLRSSGDATSPGASLTGNFQKPASVPHVDQTPGAVYDLVSERFPNEATKLFQRRVRTVIVWRPISGPVESWPLAVAEASTVPPSCLVECQRIRPMYRGDVFYMLPQEGVKWHYLSRQRSDEALVMKTFDNKEGVAGYCAHASFKLPNPPPNCPPRESIEVRAMVFSDE